MNKIEFKFKKYSQVILIYFYELLIKRFLSEQNMKQTPLEKKLLVNFKPGKITKNGFLGDDTRHIHDIIKEDLLTLSKLGVDIEEIVNRLQYFIEEGKKGLETKVDLGDFTVQIAWDRGLLPCPFGEPRRHHKIVATVFNKNLDKKYH